MIAFGDSSGKGPAAALYGALVSGLLRSLAPRHRGPADLLRALNEKLLERKVDAQYVTLLVLLWHAHSRELTMANAGATPPIVCRRGEIIRPRLEGVPIGLLDDREYDEIPLQTEPGDVIVLFSDGIEDAQNVAGESYGKRRLCALLRNSYTLAPQPIVDAILLDVGQFAIGAAVFDDQTLIVLKVS